VRVHELAKKYDIPSKDLVDQLKKLKISVKSHMSALTEEDLAKFESSRTESKKTKTDKNEKPKAVVKSASKPTAPVNKEVKPQEAPRKIIQTEKKPTEQIKVQAKTKPPIIPTEKQDIPKKNIRQPAVPLEPVVKKIRSRFPITVGDLAAKVGVSVSEMIKHLIGLGIMANINQLLDKKIVYRVAELLDVVVEEEPSEEELALSQDVGDEKNLKLRPTVVTLMGHVDHGKTSLLDAIRSTNVAEKEAGRITQHIGAHAVEIKGKGVVTFLDTPGHEAFTAMRARGANITDVVVIVVAADDGVMPQTIEAIDHARAAELPIVVAVNKTDLPAADPNRVKKELQKIGLTPEDWGGKTVCVNVSAKTKQGIDELLEMLMLEAELLELKANPNRKAEGTVIEAKITKNRGAVASIIVQKGTLKIGDAFVCGIASGKVRAMHNDRGKNVKEASPSIPVEIIGLEGVPEAGDRFYVCEDEKQARIIAEEHRLKIRESATHGQIAKHIRLENVYSKIQEAELKELKLIIKADVQGSVEALRQSLEKLSTDKVDLRVIHGGAGGINDSDVMLAAASDAVVIGFHVKIEPSSQRIVEKEGVDVRLYNIIYEAIEDVRSAMEGMLAPTIKEVIVGKAKVMQVFKSSKAGNVAGCRVVKGALSRQAKARLVRDNVVIFEGRLSSLKRFKDDVREVLEGHECGASFDGHNDVREGDVIEMYKQEQVASKL